MWLPAGAEHAPVPAVLEYLPYRKNDATAIDDSVRHPWLAGPRVRCGPRRHPRLRRLRGGPRSTSITRRSDSTAWRCSASIAAQPWCTGQPGNDGHLVGRVQQPAGRRAAPAGAQGDHHLLLDRRPLCRRRPLHGRLAPRLLHAAVGRRSCSRTTPARPIRRTSANAGARCGASASKRASFSCETLDEPPAARRLLAPGVGVRGLLGDHRGCLRRRRLVRRLHRRRPSAARGARLPAERARSGRGSTRGPRREFPARRSASCRNRFGSGITGSRASTTASWTGRCCATGARRARALRASTTSAPEDGRARSSGPPDRLAADEPVPGARDAVPGARVTGTPLTHTSPTTVGLDAGSWLPYGNPADLPADQRCEDARSLTFDSPPLEETSTSWASPSFDCGSPSDVPTAFIAVRLCDVHPDGTSALITRGILNLCHRERPRARRSPSTPG